MTIVWHNFQANTCSKKGSFENEALENDKSRKRSTQISKTKHLNLENEAPNENEALKTRKRSTQKLENEDP